jgi:regulator of protease activity HflC (stomatin/prohibitin superfamily)
VAVSAAFTVEVREPSRYLDQLGAMTQGGPAAMTASIVDVLGGYASSQLTPKLRLVADDCRGALDDRCRPWGVRAVAVDIMNVEFGADMLHAMSLEAVATAQGGGERLVEQINADRQLIRDAANRRSAPATLQQQNLRFVADAMSGTTTMVDGRTWLPPTVVESNERND